MKIYFHPEILALQNYQCLCCGRGCRSFFIPVTDKKRRHIEQLKNWPAVLGIEKLFTSARLAGKSQVGLVKHPDGRCVFLDDNHLCIIHKEFGLTHKPLSCQLFPFVLTPFGDQLRIGLRFDCPGVIKSKGSSLEDFSREVRQLAGQMVPQNIQDVAPPAVLPGTSISLQQFDALNETLIKIASSNALGLTMRLHWLRLFAEHLENIRWDKLSDEDFHELLALLRGGLLAELHQRKTLNEAPPGQGRKLIGQIFFFLCCPAEIITSSAQPLFTRIRKRLQTVSHMRKLAKSSGPLPPLRGDWPHCDLSQLEKPFPPWDQPIQEMLSRYLICRLAGLNYCGPNFYQFSMLEGLRTLLLAFVTIGWLMKIEAVKDNRDHLTLQDAQNAVMTIDGNLGYADLLGQAPAKMCLRQLSQYLECLIDWYCCRPPDQPEN